MSRLAATLRYDVRLQIRNGFYWAVAFLLAMLLIVISQLPAFDWRPVLPPLILGNLLTATFYFMAGLVLLEKGEGTLEAQIVTPLRVEEYLGSKLVTLTALSIAENLVIAVIVVGTGFRVVPLLLGIVLASALYCLAAFPAAVRYGSINELLFPTVLWTLLFTLPILQYAGVVDTPLMYLHPFQAPLVLLRGAISPLRLWEWAYAIGYGGLWIGIAFAWCRHAFRRFVVAAVGTRQ